MTNPQSLLFSLVKIIFFCIYKKLHATMSRSFQVWESWRGQLIEFSVLKQGVILQHRLAQTLYVTQTGLELSTVLLCPHPGQTTGLASIPRFFVDSFRYIITPNWQDLSSHQNGKKTTLQLDKKQIVPNSENKLLIYNKMSRSQCKKSDPKVYVFQNSLCVTFWSKAHISGHPWWGKRTSGPRKQDTGTLLECCDIECDNG